MERKGSRVKGEVLCGFIIEIKRRTGEGVNESKNARKLGLNFLFRKSGNYSLMMNVPTRALLNNYFYYFKNFKERCVCRTLSISSNYHPIVEYFFFAKGKERERERA